MKCGGRIVTQVDFFSAFRFSDHGAGSDEEEEDEEEEVLSGNFINDGSFTQHTPQRGRGGRDSTQAMYLAVNHYHHLVDSPDDFLLDGRLNVRSLVRGGAGKTEAPSFADTPPVPGQHSRSDSGEGDSSEDDTLFTQTQRREIRSAARGSALGVANKAQGSRGAGRLHGRRVRDSSSSEDRVGGQEGESSADSEEEEVGPRRPQHLPIMSHAPAANHHSNVSSLAGPKQHMDFAARFLSGLEKDDEGDW